MNNHDLGPENQAVKRWAEQGRIEPAATGNQMPFQQHKVNPFTNHKGSTSSEMTNPVLHAHIPHQNGHSDGDRQYAQSQQQYGMPVTTSTTGQAHSPPKPMTSSDQGQISSGGSHPVRYMWY